MVERCLTFNFEESTKICELNDADHSLHVNDLKPTQGFVYVDIKRPKKSEIASTSISPTATRTGTTASTSASQTTSTSTTPTTSTSTTQSTNSSATPPAIRPSAIGIQNKNIISDYYMTATSNNHIAKNARLNGSSGWWIKCQQNIPCNSEWLQINVGKIAKIIGIATQGESYNSDSYFYSTGKYNLSYSNESKFTYYNNGQVFQGNTDGNTIVYHDLKPAITARYVRIHPMKDNDKSGTIALRMELYESKEDEESCSYGLGMESRLIEDKQITASSEESYGATSNARLGSSSAWVAIEHYTNQWLQIDLHKVKRINGICTQGHQYMDQYYRWVKQYSLKYRNISNDFIDYSEVLPQAIFQGNSDSNSIVCNAIDPPIIAQIVRIVPTDWNYRIAMRVELYGCPYKGPYHGSK